LASHTQSLLRFGDQLWRQSHALKKGRHRHAGAFEARKPSLSLYPEHFDSTQLGRLLRARRQRPHSRRAAEQSDELATFHAEHGDFLPCRLASSPSGPTLGLPRAQPTAEQAGKSWGQT